MMKDCVIRIEDQKYRKRKNSIRSERIFVRGIGASRAVRGTIARRELHALMSSTFSLENQKACSKSIVSFLLVKNKSCLCAISIFRVKMKNGANHKIFLGIRSRMKL
jgi:hypothetical protein